MSALADHIRAHGPQNMLDAANWLGWKKEPDERGDPTKIPSAARSQRRGSSTDPTTWGALEQAAKRAQDDRLCGVDYVLASAVPKGYPKVSDKEAVIDLDHCRETDTGQIAPWAMHIITQMDSYAEVSPSGEGVHLLIQGRLADGVRHKVDYATGSIEVYDRARFITVTGDHLPNTPCEAMARQSELDAFMAMYLPGESAPHITREPQPVSLDDMALLAKARDAANGRKFIALYAQGDLSAYGDDHSDADFALCCLLAFWTGWDAPRMDRLFRASALMRDKWDGRRGASTYGASTIARAITMTHDRYSGADTPLRDDAQREEGEESAEEEAPEEEGAEEGAGEDQNSSSNGARDTPPPPPPYSTISAADLQEKTFEPVVWVVLNLIPQGLTVLSGKPKMGKSWLLLALAIARASGGMFLDKITLEAGPVLYLAMEDTEESLQERLEIVLGGDPAPAGLAFATNWQEWHMNQDGLKKLAAWQKAHPGGCIIIDTLAKIRPPARANANTYAEDYAVGTMLKGIADQGNCSLIVVTHNRKAKADDPFDEINASTGVAGSMDTGLVIRRERGSADAVLYTTGRRISEHSLALQFDAKDFAISEARKSILAAVATLGRATPKQIAQAVGRNHNTVKNTVMAMAKSGELIANGDGTYSSA